MKVSSILSAYPTTAPRSLSSTGTGGTHPDSLRASNLSTCPYRGIAANPYIAEGLTGRAKINEHLYWHASNRNGPEWATDYLRAPVCVWSAREIDFVDWVFTPRFHPPP